MAMWLLTQLLRLLLIGLILKGFVREYQKKYEDAVLADTGKTATGACLVNLLLSNETDLDIVAADGALGVSPYSEINVKYFTSAFNNASGTPITGDICVFY